jgi:hypothetical protein
MRRVVLPIVLLFVLAAACGKARPEEEGADKTGPVGAEKDTVAAEKPATAPEEPVSKDKVLTGKAIPTVDGGPAGEAELTLTVAEDNSVTGKLSLNGEHRLTGIVDGDKLRVWIRGGGSEPESVRRGQLVGDAAGDGYKGTFSVSGHGGVSPVQGTFAVAAK